MAKSKTFIFDGFVVDPWLKGISFAALVSDSGEISVMVDPRYKEQFEKMDTQMWLDWVFKYATETYSR